MATARRGGGGDQVFLVTDWIRLWGVVGTYWFVIQVFVLVGQEVIAG